MVDLVKTREDLIRRAATEIGKLVSGQDIEAEDHDTIDGIIDPLIQQLSLDGVVDVDPDQIDVAYFLPLARLLANEVAPSFGIAKSEDVKAADEHLLRKLTATRPTFETLKAKYF